MVLDENFKQASGNLVEDQGRGFESGFQAELLRPVGRKRSVSHQVAQLGADEHRPFGATRFVCSPAQQPVMKAIAFALLNAEKIEQLSSVFVALLDVV
jgi:hypothetical protein